MNKERLQKTLSTCGFGSRRDCEKIISDHRVLVNGRIAKLGDKVDITTDLITVDGKQIKNNKAKLVYIALNKPRKILSDIKKRDKRSIVTDLINVEEYLFIVGRLDYESEGLILLTNDGSLANTLTHPRYQHEKEYQVLLNQNPDQDQIQAWKKGVTLEGGVQTIPANVSVIRKSHEGTWMKVIMKEGKKRQIREVSKSLGLKAKRIIRTRIGTLKTGNLEPGDWRYLSELEIEKLKELDQSSRKIKV